MPQPGESLSVDDVRALEEAATVEPVEDIDIDEWLTSQAAQSDTVATVEIDGRPIKIAVVDEGEENRLLRQCRRPAGPGSPNPKELKVDMLAFRRAYVAKSLSKANDRLINPDDPRLLKMPPGTLTRLQQEIQRLSRYELPERRAADPFEFLT